MYHKGVVVEKVLRVFGSKIKGVPRMLQDPSFEPAEAADTLQLLLKLLAFAVKLLVTWKNCL